MTTEELEKLDEPAIDPGPRHIVGPGFDNASVTDKIANVVLRPISRTPRIFYIGLFGAFCLMQLLLIAATWLFYKGVGVWGIVILCKPKVREAFRSKP